MLILRIRQAETALKDVESIPGVLRVRGRVVKDVPLEVEGNDGAVVGRIISMPDRRDGLINDIHIKSGSYFPGAALTEVIVNDRFCEANGLRVEGASGDRTVKLNATTDAGDVTDADLVIIATKDDGAAAAAKAALNQYCRALAVELGPRNILANAIAPGFIDTPMSIGPDGVSELETDWFRQNYVEGHHLPLRRAGRPEEIAGVASFLAGPDAAYITGQVITVDGGLTITF